MIENLLQIHRGDADARLRPLPVEIVTFEDLRDDHIRVRGAKILRDQRRDSDFLHPLILHVPRPTVRRGTALLAAGLDPTRAKMLVPSPHPSSSQIPAKEIRRARGGSSLWFCI